MKSKRVRWGELKDALWAGTPDDIWVKDILLATGPLMDRSLGVGFALVSSHADTGRTSHVVSATGEMRDVFPLSVSGSLSLSADAFKAAYHPPDPVSLVTRALEPQLAAKLLRPDGCPKRSSPFQDAIAILTEPGPGWSAVLTAFLTHSPTQRWRDCLGALRRLQVELECALMWRLNALETPLAVLRHDGTIEHACSGLHPLHEKPLTSGSEQASPAGDEVRSTLWSRLCEGRLMLIPRPDVDGRRQYFVFSSQAEHQRRRAWTSDEKAIVRLLASGCSGKDVAWQLGLTPSKASRALTSAVAKAGLRTNADLLRTARLFDRPERAQTALLSTAEQAVWALVSQGMSNSDIAAERRTSIRTVANQVASILRKVGASSRRACWRFADAHG